MKKGTYIASTDLENGAVIFRVDGVPYTLRKGTDVEVFITERSKVIFPKEYMTLSLKSESAPKVAKKEIKKEEPKKEEPKKTQPKAEEKKEEPKTTAKKPSTRGRRKSVKIETEEK